MKIYIMLDMEGITGIVSFDNQAHPGSIGYSEAQKLMTADVNASIEGALSGGATEIIVYDMHYYGLNVILKDLNPKAQIILGKPSVVPPPGMDSSFQGVFLIGFHAMAGAKGGLLTHTYNLDVANIELNGKRVGEIGIEAAIAGQMGIPVILVSGDSGAIEEAQSLLGEVEGAMVKKPVSDRAAICLAPSVTYESIRKKASRAVKRIKDFKPFVIKPPVELRVEYTSPEPVDKVVLIPGVDRIDGRTIMIKGDDFFSIWRKCKAMNL